MKEDLLNQSNQKLIKSGDLVVDLSRFKNGFQREKKRSPTGNMGRCSVP
jgi:hypothetical protein